MRIPVTLLLVMLVVALSLVACGDDDDEAATVGPSPTVDPSNAGPRPQIEPAQALDSTAVEPQDGVVEIAMEDNEFADNYLRVAQGESVTIRVTNEGAAVHNLRIAGIDGVFGTEDDAVTTPDAIEAGAVGELTFAPQAAGAFTFQCDFHPNEMGGQVVVGDATPGADITRAPTPSPSPSPTEEGAGEG